VCWEEGAGQHVEECWVSGCAFASTIRLLLASSLLKVLLFCFVTLCVSAVAL